MTDMFFDADVWNAFEGINIIFVTYCKQHTITNSNRIRERL